jgi:two-component system, sensor histidine kinase and response regulator
MIGTNPQTSRDMHDRVDPPVLFVVDDDLPTLELLQEVAHDSGWNTVGFTRLAPLRAALDSRRPTLLIVDDDLPDGRGGDLARDIRGDPRLESIPLVVCTAATPMRQAEIGAWAPVLSKPFELIEFEEFLAAAVRRDSGQVDEGTAS